MNDTLIKYEPSNKFTHAGKLHNVKRLLGLKSFKNDICLAKDSHKLLRKFSIFMK